MIRPSYPAGHRDYHYIVRGHLRPIDLLACRSPAKPYIFSYITTWRYDGLKVVMPYPQDIDIHVLHFGKCKQAIGDLLIVEAVYAICP